MVRKRDLKELFSEYRDLTIEFYNDSDNMFQNHSPILRMRKIEKYIINLIIKEQDDNK